MLGKKGGKAGAAKAGAMKKLTKAHGGKVGGGKVKTLFGGRVLSGGGR